MKDFKIIATEDRKFFEEKIKEIEKKIEKI